MRTLIIRFAALVLLVGLCAGSLLQAQRREKRSASAGGAFTYYMLVLSYAPDFCFEPGGNKAPQECGAGNHVGFIVHGLWPQADAGRGPENCGSAGAVPQDVISATLPYIPTASLIRHEWSAHGMCTALSAADYFALLRKARDSVKIPDNLNQPASQLQLSQADVQSKMAAANPKFPQNAFRVSCYRDNKLQEVRVCMGKDLSPQACTASAGMCNAPSVTLLPVK